MIKSRNVLRSIADDIRQHFGLCFIHVFSKSQVQNNTENIYAKGRKYMKYADRYGNRWEETGLQDCFLEKLYKSVPGRAVVKVLVHPWVSRMGGWILSQKASCWLIPLFLKGHPMDQSGWVKRRFTSYNDFFMRKLKSGQRPVEEDTARIISPCDAKLTVCPITEYGIMKIKHTPYTVKELLKSEKLARAYEGGYGFVYRLTVGDYHRYIYTETGKKSGNYKIPGIFHTVNPIANDLEPIYKENTREFCLIRTTDAGTVLQMEVGALMVGKIENDQEEAFVHRGEEKGRFAFGGSTIVVLYQRGQVQPDQELLDNSRDGYETKVTQGEAVGDKVEKCRK